MDVTVLAEEVWRPRAAAHVARLAPYLEPHLARRQARVRHPVHDFLFEYYAHRPAQLGRWHPGVGLALAGSAAADHAALPGYAPRPDGTVAVTTAHIESQLPLVARLHELLAATAGREPAFGCLGLHEWAMVYRLPQARTRHHTWPLRLGPAGTDAVVEGHRIACSHFDAYRFFTEQSRPLNTLRPGRDDRPQYEQPGCLHATMDLYKHAFRLSPLVPSDLVADAFTLAWDVRILDMRAAPYDLTGLTLDPTGEPWTPVRIETPEGKQEYVEQQRAFAARARPVRAALVAHCERLLGRSPAAIPEPVP